MVRVPATETPVGALGDFYIGKYEVTKREYKAFVDAGGYANRTFWKHPIGKDGRELSWEDAQREFVDQTGRPGPATWVGGDFPQGTSDHPVSGVSWYEAAAYAEYAGMRLPTSEHWNVARGGLTPMIQWPQLGGFGVLVPFSNLGSPGPGPVGSLGGVTACGAYDMQGNVRGWCWNETGEGRVVRGGAWEDNTYESGNERQAPPMDRSPVIAGAVYVLSTVAVMGVIPAERLARSTAPFADAASAMWGPWAAVSVAVGAAASCFGLGLRVEIDAIAYRP